MPINRNLVAKFVNIYLLMQANLHDVKNAVSSAIDVMQSMGSSVCSLLDKV